MRGTAGLLFFLNVVGALALGTGRCRRGHGCNEDTLRFTNVVFEMAA